LEEGRGGDKIRGAPEVIIHRGSPTVEKDQARRVMTELGKGDIIVYTTSRRKGSL